MYYKKIEIMNNLFDGIGLTSLISAITLNLAKWILNVEWSAYLTLIISIIAIIYGVYKIKDIRLSIKLKEKQLKSQE